MKISSANKKRILYILLFINIISLIIAISYIDYIVILDTLDYEASRAEKILGIEITIPNNIPMKINIAFENVFHNIYNLLEAKQGNLKDPNNAYLMKELLSIWHRLYYSYMQIAYTTKYTKYLFFIFNYLNYHISSEIVYTIIKIIKSVIISIICIIVYFKLY
jgi:hypothetical protein